MSTVFGLVFFCVFAAIIPEGAATSVAIDIDMLKRAVRHPVFKKSDECYDMHLATLTGGQEPCSSFTPTGMCRNHSGECTDLMSYAYTRCWWYFAQSKGLDFAGDTAFKCSCAKKKQTRSDPDDFVCVTIPQGFARYSCEIQHLGLKRKWLNDEFYKAFVMCWQAEYDANITRKYCKQCSYIIGAWVS